MPTHSTRSRTSCKKKYYKKRRYLCPGHRRYKAKRRCCKHPQKISLCNRNWVRISVNPFINFLRCYKRQFPKNCPVSYIAREGRKIWKKMAKKEKEPFIEQSRRAKKRGFRT
uniref:HMG box domain-containing protein n=1 Tax=Rhodnius prolixus TaxID=13249 RepID=T1I4Y8_RHOPR